MLSLARRCSSRLVLRTRTYSARSSRELVETDELGLPKKPTWSVQELLSSYPTTPLSSDKLQHLHKLAALVPPEQGSAEWNNLSDDIGELVRLVEAVKLIDTTGVEPENMLEPIVLSEITGDESASAETKYDDEPHGASLLEHAEHSRNGFYVVDTPSSRRR
ncbi:hypothetical protein EXIGLDRAFT_720280, partial [Exidia glandulosa HHB12029]